MTTRTITLLALLGALGCNTNAPDVVGDTDTAGTSASSGTDGTTGDTAGTGSASDTASGTGTDTSQTAGTDGTTGQPGDDDTLARGVTIRRVEVNPAVTIALTSCTAGICDPIAPADRNARLPMGRNALIRVHVDLDAGFTAREIEARLLIEHDGAADYTDTSKFELAAASADADLFSTFNFGVPADQMTPGARWQVSLHETDPTQFDEPLPDPAPVAPAAPADLGVRSEPMTMEVVFVPVEIDGPTCQSTVQLTADVVTTLEDTLFQVNPLADDGLSVSVRPTGLVTTDDLITSFDPVYQPLRDARTADNAAPGAYYIAVVHRCPDNGLWSGVGGNPDDGMGSAENRIGIVDDRTQNIKDSLRWVMARLQGRPNLSCPFNQADDPDYPHADGNIGVWGFGLVDFQLRHPTANVDLSMAWGCGNRWVSDYSWDLIYDRIAIISSW